MWLHWVSLVAASVTTVTTRCVMDQLRDCGRQSQSSSCPLTVVCHMHHKHWVSLWTINTLLFCRSATAWKVDSKHVQLLKSHRRRRGVFNVSVDPQSQIWRWRARRPREAGHPTICRWRPRWRRRSREPRVFSAGEEDHVIVCCYALWEKLSWCFSEIVFILFFPGCHLFVMTRPQSCRESLLSTPTEATPGILFKGMERSQGKSCDCLLHKGLRYWLKCCCVASWIQKTPLMLYWHCFPRNFKTFAQTFLLAALMSNMLWWEQETRENIFYQTLSCLFLGGLTKKCNNF